MPQAQLTVVKYRDLDASGSRTMGEQTLQGWVFTVRKAGTTVATMTTGSGGSATTSLAPGTYDVTEILTTGWFSTDPGGAAPTKTATLANGSSVTLQFGNDLVTLPITVRGSTITVAKYNDQDHSGDRGSTEPGLAGWSFMVFDATGAAVATLTTDGSGIATTGELAPGAYTVTEVTRAGWFSTDPGGATPTKQLVLGEAPATIAFGNAPVRLPSTATSGSLLPPEESALDMYSTW
ncbi:MAG: prealbumin-like fold domain-containing protein [Elusimicrobia bacterium]|nr:prealbumin-like fold domain-containing protein [Elusimicrobiota bacterium]